MKTKIYFAVIFFFAVIALVSCKKEKEPSMESDLINFENFCRNHEIDTVKLFQVMTPIDCPPHYYFLFGGKTQFTFWVKNNDTLVLRDYQIFWYLNEIARVEYGFISKEDIKYYSEPNVNMPNDAFPVSDWFNIKLKNHREPYIFRNEMPWRFNTLLTAEEREKIASSDNEILFKLKDKHTRKWCFMDGPFGHDIYLDDSDYDPSLEKLHQTQLSALFNLCVDIFSEKE